LPQSLFASRPRTPASACATPRPRAACRALATLLLTVAFSPLARTQTPAPSQAPARSAPSATHRARQARFAAARAVAPARSGRTPTPAEALTLARAQSQLLAADRTARPDSASLTAPWTPLGPSSLLSATYNNVTGRITAIALDPNDATGNTLYLGTTGGGVWKSTNAAGTRSAVTFAPLTDDLPVFSANAGSSILPSLSIGAVALQPIANPVLLAGTGDPNDATDSLYGEGLLRSADGGATWTLIQNSHDGANGNHSFVGLATAGLAFSSVTPTLAVAAFSSSAEAALVNATNPSSIPGLYYSTDAGQTWQMATVYDGSQVVQTPQPFGTGQIGNAATAVVWDAQRQRFFAALRSHGYYASPDGVTWTRLAVQPGTGLTTTNCPVGVSGLGSANCPIFRGALAVQPATGDLYALTVDANSRDQGLWQDLCQYTGSACATPAPTFSARLDNGALDIGSGSTAIPQGTYNLTLAAAAGAANTTILLAGTIDLYRCAISAGGSSCSLRNTTNAVNGCAAPAQVAPAQHALAALAQSSGAPLVFLGNDSGLWRSLDGVAEIGAPCSASDATHFDNLNPAIGSGGSLAEVVGFAQHPTDPNTLLAGLGQNGSGATTSASTLAPWPQLAAGEGGIPQLDPATPANWFLAIGAEVNLALCPLGPNCTSASFTPPATVGEDQVANDIAALDAPTLLDPGNTQSLLVATCRVWRGPADSGTTWSSSNAISPALDGSATPCTASSALIRALAAGGPITTSTNAQWNGSQVLYAGMSGGLDGGGASIAGHVFVTKSANTASRSTAWTDIGRSPVTNDTAGFNPAAFDISSLAADPHDATGATIYATVMGFGQPHLYRSADFGAHWTNLSANLPNAPANAVSLDPNDPNTVYIALDTGVYVTTAITTCASANCWSLLGTGLPNSPVTTLAAAAQVPTGDGRIGLLRAGTYGRGIWTTPLITAAAPLIPALSLSATTLAFGNIPTSSVSTPQTLTVTSTGNASANIGTLAIAGPFRIASDTCSGQSLAPSATCTATIVFAPQAPSSSSGQISIPANVTGSPLTVMLTGAGVAPATDTLAPTSLTFAPQLLNTPSPSQSVTLTNTGDVALAIASIASSTGDFAQANTCGASLAAHAACNISIVFTPAASGARTAVLTVADSLHTQTVTLSGTGLAPATGTLSSALLTFGAQQVATTSAPQTVTLTNSGDQPLTFTSVVSSSASFPLTTTCAVSLAAHASCTLTVTFAPTATGPLTGVITLADSLGTQTVSLSGTSTAQPPLILTPTSLTFPATLVNQTSATQVITISNTGAAAVTLQTPTISGDFAIANNTCSASLPANTGCSIAITFTPTASGTRTGTLTILSGNGAQTAALTGAGNAPATDTLAPISLTFAAQQVGATSASQQVTLTNAGDAALTLIAASSSSTEFSVINDCGASLAAHATCAVVVTFTPSATGQQTATLTVSDQFHSQAVSLIGTGVAPPGVSLSPASLSFAPIAVNTTASAQAVTLTNNGGLPLTLSASSITAPFTIAATSCSTTLAPGASCTYQIALTPTAPGIVSGAFTLTTNAQPATQTVSLAATGIDFTLTPLGPTSQTISSSGTATYALQLASPASLSGSVALSCTGAPANSHCLVAPSSASLGATQTITVTITTGVAALSPAPTLPWTRPAAPLVFALSLPLLLTRKRRRRARSFTAMFIAITLIGCGAGRVIPPGSTTTTPTPTPDGSYTLTVTASSSGIAHTVQLTLLVQ
jgi:hypothetical protein